MDRLVAYLQIARAVVRGTLDLARRRQLSTYLKTFKDSKTVILLNLFVSLRQLEKRKLERLAWRVIGHRLYNDIDFEGLPWPRFRVVGLEHLERSLAAGRGAIVCTQHLGPYRRIFYELIQQGFYVHLLVDDKVSRSLGMIQDRQRRYNPDAGEALRERLTLLNAEKPGTVRQIFEALEKNEVVLVYLDGNTGVGAPGSESQVHANNVEVEFFGQPILVRRGTCQISYHKGAPLVPLFARWEPGHRAVLDFQEPILPQPETSVDDFCVEGMQRLFRLAEDVIRSRPEQFEEWVHLHRWRSPSAPTSTPDAASLASVRERLEAGPSAGARRYRIDSTRALMLSMGDDQILADAHHGRFLKLGRLMREVARELTREVALTRLLGKLERRYPREEILDAVAQLKALDLLVEAP